MIIIIITTAITIIIIIIIIIIIVSRGHEVPGWRSAGNSRASWPG